MHRLPRLHRGVQGREPGTARRFSHVGEVRRTRSLSRHPALLLGPPLQSLRRRSVRDDLPHGRALPAERRHRGLRRRALHRLQGVHARLPLRRALHRSEHEHRREVPLLRASRGGRPGAGVRDRVPRADDHRRRSRRSLGAPIARLVATEPVQVRKAEQGTRPKVFYLGADASALTPSMQAPTEHYAFATRPQADIDLVRMVAAVQRLEHGEGALSRPVYDVPHMARPWGWKVSAYLWTKSIASGTLMIAGLAALLGASPSSFLLGVVPPLVALLFLALTTGLLVFDLKRPDRFHYILFKGNRTSWLVWGAWILMAYGLVGVAWLTGAHTGAETFLRAIAVPTLLLAAGAAGYSAFLFGQAEGRDFWQSPLLLPQLLVAALAGGVAGSDAPSLRALVSVLVVALLLEATLLFAEFSGAHANVDVARAARLVTRGALSTRFWGGAVVAGIVAPLVLSAFGTPAILLGSILALGGLWIYEDVWIKAGQSIPLS